MNHRLAWEVEQRATKLLVHGDLVVLGCAVLSFKRGEEQSLLRAYDLGGHLRWDVARANVDQVHLAPNTLGGRVVAAIVNLDRTTRIVDVGLEGAISLERETAKGAPRLIDALQWDYAALISSDADDLFFFSTFSKSPHVVCGRAGAEGFLWSSDAGVLDRTRDCATATLSKERRKGNGHAALALNDGAILWEAQGYDGGGYGCSDTGEVLLDPAGTIYNTGPRSFVGLRELPRGEIAWKLPFDGTRARPFVARDAVYILTDLPSGEGCLTIVDWKGNACAHTVAGTGPSTEIYAVGHGWIVWRTVHDVWCTSVDAPSEIAWRAPFTTPTKQKIDQVAFAPDGSLFVLRDGKNLACFRA
jgi:hypothetical protein